MWNQCKASRKLYTLHCKLYSVKQRQHWTLATWSSPLQMVMRENYRNLREYYRNWKEYYRNWQSSQTFGSPVISTEMTGLPHTYMYINVALLLFRNMWNAHCCCCKMQCAISILATTSFFVSCFIFACYEVCFPLLWGLLNPRKVEVRLRCNRALLCQIISCHWARPPCHLGGNDDVFCGLVWNNVGAVSLMYDGHWAGAGYRRCILGC